MSTQPCVRDREHWRRGRRAGGFSLIELLVVVTIIIALLAILAPSMGRAVEWVQWTQCVNNLDQITTGVLSYAMDNSGFILGGEWTNPLTPQAGYRWVGNAAGAIYNVRQNQLVWGGYLGERRGNMNNDINDKSPWVYRCPSDTRTHQILSYCSSEYINGSNNVQWPTSAPPPVHRLSSLKMPSSTFFIVEENNTQGVFITPAKGMPNAYHMWMDYVNSFHMGDGNSWSFMDGHVLARTNEDPLTKGFHLGGAPWQMTPNSPDLRFITDAYTPGVYLNGSTWVTD